MNDLTVSSPSAAHKLDADFVRRACLRYVQNREVANDLTQDILLKIACGNTGFSGESRPETWLYRVTVNHCLDHLRREKRLRGKAEQYAFERRCEGIWEIREEGPAYGENPENATSRRVLERLREKSGETDRRVVTLRFDLGLSQSGIAEILGVSRPAVGQRLARIQARALTMWQQFSHGEREDD